MTLSDVRRPQADSIRPDAAELLGGAAAALLEENYPLRATIVRAGQGVPRMRARRWWRTISMCRRRSELHRRRRWR